MLTFSQSVGVQQIIAINTNIVLPNQELCLTGELIIVSYELLGNILQLGNKCQEVVRNLICTHFDGRISVFKLYYHSH